MGNLEMRKKCGFRNQYSLILFTYLLQGRSSVHLLNCKLLSLRNFYFFLAHLVTPELFKISKLFSREQ